MYQQLSITGLFFKFCYQPNLIISLLCWWISYSYGWAAVTALFWFKLITFLIIAWHTDNIKTREYYFFYNLGYSKIRLWVTAFIIDLCILLLMLMSLFYVA